MNLDNILLHTDSYKFTHWKQYPPKTETVFSYIESRGGEYDKTVFFGLQIFLKKYLSKPITQEMIDEADAFVRAHLGFDGLFNKEGWQYILDEHNGYLPIKIKAVPEGTVVPTKNVLVTIENTDPKCYWLTSYLETAILKAVWYPTTVATISWSIKQVLRQFLEETADDLSGLPFMLHDFGYRGVSSEESAGIGGAAHLVNFMGTDTVAGAMYAMHYYPIPGGSSPMRGFSVPAAEHSSVTSWGKDGELDAYRNMLKQFGRPGSIVSVVSDSYDIFNAVQHLWGEELKQEVIDSGATIVIRPDSGDPATVVWKIAHLLADAFGYTKNSKGYKVLNHVRIIQGDGINEESIKEILLRLKASGFSASNVVFGMGGALLQKCDRDTLKWAMKCSAAKIDGKWVDVYKSPITDTVKHSKKGHLTLYRDNEGRYETVDSRFAPHDHLVEEVLTTVYKNGNIVVDFTFDQVRNKSEL